MTLHLVAIAGIFILAFVFNSCNDGLAPPPKNPTLSGTVHFAKHWPPADSVNILAVVLVQPNPPFADSTLISGLNTTVLPFTLNYLSSDTTYQFSVKPGTYGYLGVAQNYNKLDLFHAWNVVAFAHNAQDSTRSFVLMPGDAITGVDLYVNFDSLPRQPFIK